MQAVKTKERLISAEGEHAKQGQKTRQQKPATTAAVKTSTFCPIH